MHVCVDVYMYLIFVMTEQNISNDSDKGAQVCISPAFIEPCVNQGIKVWLCIDAGCTLATLTVAPTCLATGGLDRRKTEVS